MVEDRAARNLREDIAAAHTQLKRWREDGHAERIAFWLARRDELLDRLPRSQQPVEAPQ